MTQKLPFRWSAKTEAAAVLVADDEISDEEIAKEVGIDRSTLKRWKRDPEFRDRVHLHVDRLARELSKYRIARKDKRVAAYQDRWAKLHRIIDARGDALKDEVAGGDTGLVSKEIDIARDGGPIEKYSTDTGLLSAMLSLEKQAAQEAGQWTEKAETTHTGEVTMRTYRGVDVEAV